MLKFGQVIGFAAVCTALLFAAPVAMSADGGGGTKKKAGPVQVAAIDGAKVKQVTLTEKGAKRIDIQTAEVGAEGSGQYVPYSSVVYDTNGGAWVYALVKPLTFVRQEIVVSSIKGDKAYVTSGPSAGTKVVVTGVAELYGAEKGLGH